MNKTISILLILLYLGKIAYPQNLSGLINDNYAGVSSMLINPAYIADSKIWLDINFLTTDTYVENNFLYIPAKDFQFKNFFYLDADWKGDDDKLFSDYYSKNRKWNLYAQEFIQLPSAMYNVGGHGFAFHSALRMHFNSLSIHNPLSKFISEGLSYRPLQNILFNTDKINIREALWFETGITYARTWKKPYKKQWSFGATVKKTVGINGLMMTINDMDYIVLNDSTFYSPSYKLDFAYTSTLPSNNQIINIGDDIINGGGWSADVGIVFQKKATESKHNLFKKPCQQVFDDYIYKVGISFLDIGYINFNNNSIRHSSNNSEIYWENLDKYKFDDFDKFAEDINSHSNFSMFIKDRSFSMFLPSTLSVQFDYSFEHRFFINSTLFQSLPIGKIRLTKPNLFLIAPRFESRYIGFSMPFAFYEWYKPRLGLSLRLFNFTIGTDYLNTLLGLNDFSGFDIYFAVKISFAKGYCKENLSDFFKGVRYYNRACYNNF